MPQFPYYKTRHGFIYPMRYTAGECGAANNSHKTEKGTRGSHRTRCDCAFWRRAGVTLRMQRVPVLLQMGTMSRVAGLRLPVHPPAFLGFRVPGVGTSVSILPFWRGLQNGNQMNLERLQAL